MTNEEKQTALRGMVGGLDSEEVLSTYLFIAGQKIINIVFPYENDIKDVPYLLNKRGAEGQTQHSENGITRQYENADIPSSMLKSLTPYCGTIK